MLIANLIVFEFAYRGDVNASRHTQVGTYLHMIYGIRYKIFKFRNSENVLFDQ